MSDANLQTTERNQRVCHSSLGQFAAWGFLERFGETSDAGQYRDMSKTAAASLVYFVEIGKVIKIGFTTNLNNRLKQFLNSAPSVELLLTIPGGRGLERDLHNLLVDRRVTREMYHHRDDRIRGFIRHYEQQGLQPALDYLGDTTPEERAERREEARLVRERCRRQTKAEKDAYFASLVAQRKERLGW